MDAVIKVEGVGKRYYIGHQQVANATIKESLAAGLQGLGRRLLHPFLASASEPFPGMAGTEEFWALRDVSFTVKQGEQVGIIGSNGAGKSTLLKILSRITEPTNGRVRLKGRTASLLEVGTGFHPDLTGRENIFLNGAILGMGREEISRKFDEIVAFAEVEKFLDTPVKRYSSGMYVRLAFAVSAHLEPEILIVDEVLAVGDAQFQRKCLGRMEKIGQEGRTVVFVSHQLQSVKNLCRTGILLQNGFLVKQGPVSDIIALYETSLFDDRIVQCSGSGVLFSTLDVDRELYSILQVTLLDLAGKPINKISTFDSFKIDVRFHSPREKRNGSVGISFRSLNGNILIRCVMQPDSGFGMTFRKGENEVMCTIQSIPLPSGKYLVTVGLSDPPHEWLCSTDIGLLDVSPTDVFQSGFPPTDRNCSMVAVYSWDIV